MPRPRVSVGSLLDTGRWLAGGWWLRVPALLRAKLFSFGFSHPSGRLFEHINRVADIFQIVYPTSSIFRFGENVASMTASVRRSITSILAFPCYSACPSAVSPVSRPRLYWCDWVVPDTSDAVISHAPDGLREVSFTQHEFPHFPHMLNQVGFQLTLPFLSLVSFVLPFPGALATCLSAPSVLT